MRQAKKNTRASRIYLIMKMRRDNRKTRVDEPRNWIRREREFVSFLPMQRRQGEREGRRGSEARRIDVSRNSLRMEFDDRWRSYEYIVQKKDFFFCTVNLVSLPPSLPYPANLRRSLSPRYYSASACNDRGHWRVAMLMNFGSMLPESTWWFRMRAWKFARQFRKLNKRTLGIWAE